MCFLNRKILVTWNWNIQKEVPLIVKKLLNLTLGFVDTNMIKSSMKSSIIIDSYKLPMLTIAKTTDFIWVFVCFKINTQFASSTLAWIFFVIVCLFFYVCSSSICKCLYILYMLQQYKKGFCCVWKTLELITTLKTQEQLF